MKRKRSFDSLIQEVYPNRTLSDINVHQSHMPQLINQSNQAEITPILDVNLTRNNSISDNEIIFNNPIPITTPLSIPTPTRNEHKVEMHPLTERTETGHSLNCSPVIDNTQPKLLSSNPNVLNEQNEVELVEPHDIDSNLCSICFEPIHLHGPHRITATPCGHVFGGSCITSWIQNGRGLCPVCKMSIPNKDQLIPLYLGESLHSIVDKHSKLMIQKGIQAEKKKRFLEKQLSQEAISYFENIHNEISGFLKNSKQNNDIIILDDSDDDVPNFINSPSTNQLNHPIILNEDKSQEFLVYLKDKTNSLLHQLKKSSIKTARQNGRKYTLHKEFQFQGTTHIFSFLDKESKQIVHDLIEKNKISLRIFNLSSNEKTSIPFDTSIKNFVDIQVGNFPASDSPLICCATLPNQMLYIVDPREGIISQEANIYRNLSCLTTNGTNNIYCGTEFGSIIQMDIRFMKDSISEMQLPNFSYHLNQPITSIKMIPNTKNRFLCCKGASGLFHVNFKEKCSCFPLIFPTLRFNPNAFYNFDISFNEFDGLWASSYVSHRSANISLNSTIFKFPENETEWIKYEKKSTPFSITSATTLFSPYLLDIPTFDYPPDIYPTIKQLTGLEHHDLRIPLIFSNDSWDENQNNISSIAIAQNKNILFFNISDGHIIQNYSPDHSYHIECMKKCSINNSYILGSLSKHEIKLSILE